MIKRPSGGQVFSLLPGPLCTAFFLHLAFSSPKFGFCIWFAFIPLLWSLRARAPRQAFIQGIIAGFAFYYLNLFWITNSIQNFSALPIPIALLIMALLAMYLGLYFGLFCLLLAATPLTSWFSLLFLASGWTLLEWLRGTLFVGFPWNNLGTALSPGSPFAFFLPYGGIYSLSFLIIITNLALFSLISSRDTNFSLVKRLAALLIIPALYIFLPVGNHVGTANLNKSLPIKVTIIQPNIPQAEKWDPAYRERNFSILEQLSLEATAQAEVPHLVIWPEASLPDFFQDAPLFRKRISALTREGNFYLLAGSPQYDIDNTGKHRYFNSALLFSPAGTVIAGYNKIKLVPFGEFTPLVHYFPFLGKMVPGADFSAGHWQKPMDLGNISLVPSICFEGIFPEFIAGGMAMADKPGCIVNITNDAWFGISSGPRQHILNVRMRARENRCYLLRCANTGISAIIDPDGEIIKQLPLGKRGKLEAIIYPAADATFYARHPYLLILLLTIIAAGGVIRRFSLTASNILP